MTTRRYTTMVSLSFFVFLLGMTGGIAFTPMYHGPLKTTTPTALWSSSQNQRKQETEPMSSAAAEESEFSQATLEEFVAERNSKMKGEKRPGNLFPTSADELRELGCKCFLSRDKLAGACISDDNEAINVFNFGSALKGDAVVAHATNQGANKMSCFDGALVRFYKKNGFVEYRRISWKEYLKVAPPAFDPKTFNSERYGYPDAVYLKLAEGKEALRIRSSLDRGDYVITLRPFKRGTLICQSDVPGITIHSLCKDGKLEAIEDPILCKLTQSSSPNTLLAADGGLWALEDIWANEVISIDYGASGSQTAHGEQPDLGTSRLP